MELVAHGGGMGKGLELADEFEIFWGKVFFETEEPVFCVGGKVVGL